MLTKKTQILGIVLITLLVPVVLAEIISGDENNNNLEGTNNSDWIEGRGGDDNINGKGGNDTLLGDGPGVQNPGDDGINGGGGNDEIEGGPGNDNLNGGSGDDTINGGSGQDDISGGPGNDTVKDSNNQNYGHNPDGEDDDIDVKDGVDGNDTVYAGTEDRITADDGDIIYIYFPSWPWGTQLFCGTYEEYLEWRMATL